MRPTHALNKRYSDDGRVKYMHNPCIREADGWYSQPLDVRVDRELSKGTIYYERGLRHGVS